MALLNRRLLGVGTPGMTSQDAVALIELRQFEAEFLAGAGQDLLEYRDARFALAALYAGDFGLGDTRPLCQLPLRKACLESSQPQERARRGSRSLGHDYMIADRLSVRPGSIVGAS